MIWLLLVLFQIKHFVADYLLQNEYMLGKFKDKDWALPLSTHCFVHAWLTFCVAINVTTLGLSLMVSTLDFGLHFIMDRVKASPKMLGKYHALTKIEYRNLRLDLNDIEDRIDEYSSINFYPNGLAKMLLAKKSVKLKMDSNRKFWWTLGLDQGVHHLTHYLIIAIILL